MKTTINLKKEKIENILLSLFFDDSIKIREDI